MVSVVIPCYNVAHFVGTTLNSVLNQSDENFEIIAVNDGSTDKTLVVLKESAALDNRIQVICQANGGVSAARNKGLSHAKGDWIVFLDGDDEMKPDFIKLLNSTPLAYSMVATGFEWIKKGSITRYPLIRTNNLIEDFLHSKIKLHLCSTAYTKEFLQLAQLQFAVGTAYNEDREFIAKALHKAQRIMCIKDCYFRYISRESSVSYEEGYQPKRLTSIKACERIYEYFLETPYAGPALNHLAYTILRHYRRCSNSTNVDVQTVKSIQDYVRKYLSKKYHFKPSKMGFYNRLAQLLYPFPTLFNIFIQLR